MASPGLRVGQPPLSPSAHEHPAGPISAATCEAFRRAAIEHPDIVQANLFHLFEGLQAEGLSAKVAWEAVSPVLHALASVSKAASAPRFIYAMQQGAALAHQHLHDYKRPYLMNWLALCKDGHALCEQIPPTNLTRVKGAGAHIANPAGSQVTASINHVESGGYYCLTERADDAITALACITEGVLAVGTANGYVSLWWTTYAKADNPLDKGEMFLMKTFKAHSSCKITGLSALHVPSQLQTPLSPPGSKPAKLPPDGPVFLTCSSAGMVKAWRLTQTMGPDRKITYYITQQWATKVDGPVLRLATAAASSTWAVITQATNTSPGLLLVFASETPTSTAEVLRLNMPEPGALTLMPDGGIVIFSVKNAIYVYRVKPCVVLATLTEHEKYVSSLAVSRNSTCLLSGTTCFDGKKVQAAAGCSIKVWDLHLTNGQQKVALRQTIKKAHEGGVTGITACTNDCDTNMFLSYGKDSVRMTSNNPKPVSVPLTYTRGEGCGMGVEGSWQTGWRVYMTTPAGRAVRMYAVAPGHTFPK